MRYLSVVFLMFIMIFSVHSNTVLDRAINELGNLEIDEYKDIRNKDVINKIRRSVELAQRLIHDQQFEIIYFGDNNIILFENTGLKLNENSDGFNLYLPEKILSEKYYDLLLTTLAKNFIELYDIYTIRNYYEITQNNVLEKYLYTLDYIFIEYILLSEYITSRYNITSKWCNAIMQSEDENQLQDIGIGLYGVDNRIAYKILGFFDDYSQVKDLAILEELKGYILEINDSVEISNMKYHLNLNSVIFAFHYLNFSTAIINAYSTTDENGARTIEVKHVNPHLKILEDINSIIDIMKTDLRRELVMDVINQFKTEILTE